MTDSSRFLTASLIALVAMLSACKDERVREPAPADPALVINGQTVDPMCFIQRSEDEENPSYPTANCDLKDYIADPSDSPIDKQFISTNYYYVDPEMPEQKFPGFVGYKYLGEYRGLKAVQTLENGGGTGTFTALQLLKPEKDGTLSIKQTLAGGDRCNGGIANAFMDGGTLVYDINLTPFDFFTVAESNPKGLKAYDDIDACAICCYGHLRYVNGKPDSVSLLPDAIQRIQTVPEEEQTMQSCFDEVFRRKVEAGETTISLKEMKKFVGDFNGTCTAQ